MIAHVDADSFFAAVLVRKNPKLKGKPLLALGMGGGCVISASYEAKAYGVKTGMPLKEALALVPHAVHMPSDFTETGLASQQIEDVLQAVSPDIEQMSVDEWFLDLRGVPGGVPHDLPAFAENLRRRVNDMTGLSVSAGVAPSKLLAKMASEYRKPAGVTVVSPQVIHTDVHLSKVNAHPLSIEQFLRDRPAAAIPGVGRKRSVHTQANGWETAWDIAQASTPLLIKLFGRPGSDMQRELLGEELSDVVSEPAPPKSVSRARSFPRLKDGTLVWSHALRHLEYITLKMRRYGLACRGLSLWLRNDQYEYQSSHVSLPKAMDTEEALQPYLKACFRKLWQRDRAYTQVGACLWRLQDSGVSQLSLFEDPYHAIAADHLQRSLDNIHNRYGRDAVTKGAALKTKSGWKPHFELPLYEQKGP